MDEDTYLWNEENNLFEGYPGQRPILRAFLVNVGNWLFIAIIGTGIMAIWSGRLPYLSSSKYCKSLTLFAIFANLISNGDSWNHFEGWINQVVVNLFPI